MKGSSQPPTVQSPVSYSLGTVLLTLGQMAAIDEIPVANGSATHTEGSFVNPRQFTIFTQSWVPASPMYVLPSKGHGFR